MVPVNLPNVPQPRSTRGKVTVGMVSDTNGLGLVSDTNYCGVTGASSAVVISVPGSRAAVASA